MDASDTPESNELVELVGDTFTLKYDREALGIWTDVAELNRILLHSNLPGLESMGGKPNPDEPTRMCPDCKDVDMMAIEGGKKHSIIFETCEVCSGVWIEAEEEVTTADEAIKEIVEFFKLFRQH